MGTKDRFGDSALSELFHKSFNLGQIREEETRGHSRKDVSPRIAVPNQGFVSPFDSVGTAHIECSLEFRVSKNG